MILPLPHDMRKNDYWYPPSSRTIWNLSFFMIFHLHPQTSINNNRGVLEMGIPKTMVEF